MFKKLLSLLTTIALLLSIAPSAFAASEESAGVQTDATTITAAVDYSKFTDVKGHWAEEYLKWAVKNGLMCGVTPTKMVPNGNITRAQMTTMITRAFGATKEADIGMFVDVDKEDWCYSAIAKGVQMGFLGGFGNAIAPNEPVTRQEVATSLVKAAGYVVNSGASVYKFTDSAKIDPNTEAYIATAIAHGLMQGYADGRLGPNDKVTRAQFAAIMYRLANAYMNQTATYTSKRVDGSLMVGVGNIKLGNMDISKNLFLTDGVGTGDIVIDGTDVHGTVYVRGTGSNTLKVVNGASVSSVVLCNPNNAVRLVVEEGSSVGSVSVVDAVTSVTLEGNVGDVRVYTAKAPIKLLGAEVDDLYLANKLVQVSIDKKSDVDIVRMASSAAGADIEMMGTVGTLYLDSPDSKVKLDGKIDNLEFGSRASGCEISVGNGASMKNVDIDADGVELTLSGDMKSVDISGDDCNIKFGGTSSANKVTISGDDTTVEFSSGCTVKDVYTSGDNLELKGSGKVEKITVTDGEDVAITIPNVAVYNKGGKDVYIGSYKVSRGETATSNSSGSGVYVAPDVDIDGDGIVDIPGGSTGGNTGGTGGNTGGSGGTTGGGTTGGGTGGTGGDSGITQVGPYTVTLNPNGGVVQPTYVRTNAVGVVPTLPTPLRNTYTFDGWYTTVDGGTKVESGAKVTMNTTLYAHWNPPAEEEIPATPTTMNLMYPVDATPSDFGYESIYTLSTFGTGLSYTMSTGVLNGTVNYVEDFKWYEGEREQYATGYYVPIRVQPSVQLSSGIFTVDGCSFGSEIVSTGQAYSGDIIGWIQLNPAKPLNNEGRRTATVTYDPDGPDGNIFAPAVAVVDYTDVIYNGGNAELLNYKNITAIDGVDGAETAQITVGEFDGLNLDVTLSTQCLLETKYQGRYGNWVGINIPAFTDCGSLQIRETSPADTQATYNYSVESDGSGNKYVTWVTNATNKSVGDGIYELELTWMDLEGEVSSYKTVKLIVDISACKLAGESSGEEPNETVPVVDNLEFAVMTADELTEEFEMDLDDFAVNLRIQESSNTVSVGGIFTHFTSAEDTLNGFYLPLKITGVAAATVDISRDSGQSIAKTVVDAEDDGSFVVYCLLEILPYGSGLQDTKLSFKPNPIDPNISHVDVVLSTENSMATDSALIVTDTAPTGEVAGFNVESLASDLEYRLFYNTADIDGTVAHKSSVEVYGNEYDKIWLVPVRLRVKTESEEFTLRVSNSQCDSFMTITQEDVVDGFVNILIPVGIDSIMLTSNSIELLTGDGGELEVVSATTVYFNGELTGFVPGVSEDVEVLPDPTDFLLESIEVTTQPTDVEYIVGETFNPEGMVVTATYSNKEDPEAEDVEQTVSVLTFVPGLDTPLTTEDNKVTVSYTHGEVTESAEIEITVTEAQVPEPEP